MFDVVTSDPETRELIRMREGGLHDYVSGINSARREGEMRKAREAAINLISAGVAPNVVASSLGLSLEELNSLKHH
jgi:hypothetical protein